MSPVEDDQSLDRELFKGLSRDRVLRRRVTAPRGSQASHVHRQYEHVRPWRKSLSSQGLAVPLLASSSDRHQISPFDLKVYCI
jgi:hypothetical protein